MEINYLSAGIGAVAVIALILIYKIIKSFFKKKQKPTGKIIEDIESKDKMLREVHILLNELHVYFNELKKRGL